jgi:CRISPR system Cascade subunit CasD
MPVLLLRLVGPMQSWGITSRFGERDTGKEPSKSGVLGLLAAALGIDRTDWKTLEPLTHLKMGVRHDCSGVLHYDYQTAQGIISANGEIHETATSERYFLADAAFLVGLESPDRDLLERTNQALRNPHWPLALGRKSYVPSESIWIPNGLREGSLESVLRSAPLLSDRIKDSTKLLISLESEDRSGSMRMDQIVSSFAERRFSSRFVRSEWLSLTTEESDVSV